MAFNVNYNAGGVVDEVKKIKAILGGVIDEVKVIDNILGGVLDEVKVVDLVKKIELLDKIGLIDRLETLGNIEGGTINTVEEVKKVDLVEAVTQLDTLKNIEGGTINEVNVVDKVNSITGFPQFTQPFNEMVKLDIPATTGTFTAKYETPDYPIEILCLTVTCSGYGSEDNYDLFFNEDQWFKNWYCSEVKEGLYLGSSATVYKAAPKSTLTLNFKNDSGTSKTLWFGIRMLKEHSTT